MVGEPPRSQIGLPPTKIQHFNHNYTDLADGSSITIGSRSQPGYALAYHIGTTQGAPPVAADLEWDFAYDGETDPSHAAIAMGDAISPPGESRSTPHHGFHWTQDSNDNSWSYVAYREPIPYDSIEVGVTNTSGAASPEGWISAIVADRLDNVAPMRDWRRHAQGTEDEPISDGERKTLVETSGRGRLYGFWFDTGDHASIDQDVEVYIDGESSPSIAYNTGFVNDLWRTSDNANYDKEGSVIFGIGEHDSGEKQLTFYFTPGHQGMYSTFESSLSVEVLNNGGAGELDYCVVWDEAV